MCLSTTHVTRYVHLFGLDWIAPITFTYITHKMGYAVVRLVEALRYKPEGRGFDFRWCRWNFVLT
jgi:hypothetical protein